MPGAVNLGPDAKARITDTILSTVQPRPIIEDIAVVDGHAAGAQVVVIRVGEGTFPPYQYQRGATVRIPVRIQDTNRQATVKEIEALFEKRRALETPAADVASAYNGPDFFCTYDSAAGERQENQFHKISLVPRVPLRIRQDTKFERQFEKLILSAFPSDRTFTRKCGRGHYYQTERREQGPDRTHRVWRVWSEGALGFVGNLTRPFPRGYPVGDLVADLLFFLRLAAELYHGQRFYGDAVLRDELWCNAVKFAPEFPPPNGFGDYDHVPGIHLPAERGEGRGQGVSIEEITRAVLDDPEEMVADLVLGQLRENCDASIHFDKLLEAVRNLSEQSRRPGWGKRFP